jgi:putative tricarboxylic transport membrane protein
VTRPEGDGASRRATIGLRIFALAVCALGGLTLYESTRIRSAAGFSPFGPTVMVIAVGVLMVMLALLFLVRLGVRPDRELIARVSDEERATHWPTTGLLAGVLAVYALVLGLVGYIVATGLLVPIGAWVLGSRQPKRDAVVGVALGLTVYVTFTGFLGVRLPAGVLAPVLP